MVSEMVDAQSGLPASPFQITAPDYDYWSQAHSLAAERLEFAIGSMILLTVFTGDVGSGKSTVVRKVVNEIQDKTLVGNLSYSAKLSVDPCRAILDAFGADPGPGDPAAHRRILEHSLIAARYQYGLPTLIVDDAHSMPEDKLANLFEIAGFHCDHESALFKRVLVGHTELYDRLNRDMGDMLGPSFSLDAMSEKDTAGYVRHRLAAAGTTDAVFADDALGAIYERTRGNPLRVNLVCMFALDEAKELGRTQIDARTIHDCYVPAADVLSLDMVDASASSPVPGSDPLRRDLEPLERAAKEEKSVTAPPPERGRSAPGYEDPGPQEQAENNGPPQKRQAAPSDWPISAAPATQAVADRPAEGAFSSFRSSRQQDAAKTARPAENPPLQTATSPPDRAHTPRISLTPLPAPSPSSQDLQPDISSTPPSARADVVKNSGGRRLSALAIGAGVTIGLAISWIALRPGSGQIVTQAPQETAAIARPKEDP